MQGVVESVGDDGVFAGFEHPDADDDGVWFTGEAGAGGSAAGTRIEFDAGFAGAQFFHDLDGGKFDAVRVVGDEEVRNVIGNFRDKRLRFDGGERVFTFAAIRSARF